MAEQSSVVVVFRALVMMACLIAIPLAALFGASLPEALKAIQQGRWPTSAHVAQASADPGNSSEEPAKFEPTPHAAPVPGAAAIAVSAPTAASEPVQAATATCPPAMPADWPKEGSPPASPVVPVSFEGTSQAIAPRDSRSDSSADPFIRIQDRLRSLGATYYCLEAWGGQQQLYRFYCQMAVGGNANYTRYFEKIESSPLRAMTAVLQQVETWHGQKK